MHLISLRYPGILQKSFNLTLGFSVLAGLVPQSQMRFSQMGEELSGHPAILEFILRLPLETLLSKFPLFLFNNWNFHILCDLSTCLNLSIYKSSVFWNVLNIEYVNASVFWTIRISKGEKKTALYMMNLLNQQSFLDLFHLLLFLRPGWLPLGLVKADTSMQTKQWAQNAIIFWSVLSDRTK